MRVRGCVAHGSPNQELGFVHTCCPPRGCSVSKAWGEENKRPWETMMSHAEGVEKWCKRDRKGKKNHQKQEKRRKRESGKGKNR